MLCESCHQNRPDTKSAVVNGIYYRNICQLCLAGRRQVSSGHARWSRSIDAEDNEWAIQQPWGADGLPNPKFIRLYPDKARNHFTEDEIRRYS